MSDASEVLHDARRLRAVRPSSDAVDLRDLASLVMGPRPVEPFGLYAFHPDDDGAALPQAVAESVYAEAYGYTPELLREEFSPYNRATLLICVLDHRLRAPAGLLRLIFPSQAGLKDLNEIEQVWGRPRSGLFADSGIALEERRTINIGTLAVAPGYRKAAFQGLITMALVQALTALAARCDMPWGVAVVYAPVLRMLQWKLQRPFNQFAGTEPRPYPYAHSPLHLPVWTHRDRWMERLAARDPVLYDIMARGVGLEPVVRPFDWDLMTDRVGEITGAGNRHLRLR